MISLFRTSAAIVVLAAVFSRAGDFVPGGPNTRGLPRVEGNAVVTDWGTPMRGGCWGMAGANRAFAREELVTIKYCGMNAVHIYAEKNDDKPVGWAAPYMDSVVEWCRQESLYVVMTFGNSHLTSYGKVYTFWEFYAPRYKDMTHVIYEIKNEACSATYHCADNAMQMYIDCHKIIRDVAPDNHVMLMSHSNIKGGINSLFEDVERLGPDVDWTKCSLAFHGYGTTGAFQEAACRALGAEGYAMSCTEFPYTSAGDLAPAYERAGISYFWFEACWSGPRTLGTLCGYLRQQHLSWAPDFGTWPQQHVEHPEPVAVRYLAQTVENVAPALSRLMLTNIPGNDMGSTYDLAGRLLWERRDGDSFRSGHGPHPRIGSRVVVVKRSRHSAASEGGTR